MNKHAGKTHETTHLSRYLVTICYLFFPKNRSWSIPPEAKGCLEDGVSTVRSAAVKVLAELVESKEDVEAEWVGAPGRGVGSYRHS